MGGMGTFIDGDALVPLLDVDEDDEDDTDVIAGLWMILSGSIKLQMKTYTISAHYTTMKKLEIVIR
jgi:hypothetical protein